MTRSATVLVVDARKAFDAGIGTYIRHLLPRVALRLDVPMAALVPAGQAERFDWLAASRVRLIEMRAAPLSLAEQLELPRAIGTARCFWATSLAHPLFGHTPLVATVHDVAQLALPRREMGGAPWLRSAVAAYLGSLRRRARALLAVSGFTEGEFVRRVGSPRHAAFTVTPLGVEPAWFTPRSPTAQAPYLLCLGSVRPHKNVERLLQAFALVAARIPHRLRVVGRLPADGAHLRWLAALPEPARSRVVFDGALDDAALRACMASADALVFPSLYEGFGLPVLEAMAAGCPVVASRAGALTEVCCDASAATFDPRNVADMARAIEAAVSLDPAAQQRIVERGCAHAARFTWDATAEKTAQILRAVLEGGAGT
jgi:glycosyltransferase involved in cell wall biosynthesis